MIIREVMEPQTVLAMVSMGIGITLIADSYAANDVAGGGVSPAGRTHTRRFVYRL